MNNFKFRGKTADDKWVYGPSIAKGVKYYRIRPETTISNKKPWVSPWIEVRPETVGQWTGLKDKNGKDGFCGDLAKHKDGIIFQIVFNTELASFCLKFSFGGSCCFTSFDRLNKLSEYDIIGNIHDNPEMLEDNNAK